MEGNKKIRGEVMKWGPNNRKDQMKPEADVLKRNMIDKPLATRLGKAADSKSDMNKETSQPKPEKCKAS